MSNITPWYIALPARAGRDRNGLVPDPDPPAVGRAQAVLGR